jgi:hypothetical protein
MANLKPNVDAHSRYRTLARPRHSTARKRNERGFTLPLLGVCATVMVGMLGLAMDCGRMFILKNELQTFVDASAMAAVSRLDGTQAGVQAANSAATGGPLGATKPNGYNFDSAAIPNADITTGYAGAFNGTYDNYATASAATTNSYRFVSVQATGVLSLYFLTIVPAVNRSLSLSATAIAGQKPQPALSRGMMPFIVDAHNQNDTRNFGLTSGNEYTLKWGKGNSTSCAGDAGFSPPGSPPSQHGFVDIGEGNSNSNVRTAIEYGAYPNVNSNPSSISTGVALGGVPGNRGSSIFDALAGRAAQDTNDTSTTFAQYESYGTGNGRRVVTVAIGGTWAGNGANAHTPVLGFASFFLETTYSGTSGPICATYIGPANLNGYGSGGTDGTQVYSDVLYK